VLRLYTFNISHFSEKARWALDFEGIAYEEKVLLPGPHQFVTRRIAPKSHVPVLVHDGRVVQESSAIVDYIGERLGGRKLTPAEPAARERARALEAKLDQVFGAGTQRVFYSAALADRELVTGLFTAGGPFWARGFYAFAYPGVAAVIKRMYKANDPAAVERAKQRFAETFAELDRILEAQPYLGGDAPSRADICSAALLAPLCRPPEHRISWPAAPAALTDFVAQFENRPTWNHALRMYREHRLPAAAGSTRSPHAA
jgi:glutathione S-transferase